MTASVHSGGRRVMQGRGARRSLQRPWRRLGFTLLELMVATTASAIAVSSMYMISRATTQHFREQQRISNVQGSLRSSMEQLKHDVVRAGFGSTPNALFYPPCAPAAGVQPPPAFQVFDADADPSLLDPVGGHVVDGQAIHGDRLQLVGNFHTSAEYVIRDLNAGTVELDPNWSTFVRDFMEWRTEDSLYTVVDAPAFNRAFRGRMLRVVGQDGSRFFSVVEATAPAATPPTLSLTPALNPACTSFRGAVVNPVAIMSYQVQQAVGLDAPSNPEIGGENIQLVRQELDLAGLPMGNSPPRVIAERVVHFNVDVITNTTLVRNEPALLQPAIGANAQGAAPERIFSAIITLAVRSPMLDQRFTWIAQNPGEELTRFTFDNTRLGAARVRVGRAEVFLPNIAYQWFSQ